MTTEKETLGSVDNISTVQSTRAKPLLNPEMEMLRRKQREGNPQEKQVIDFLFSYEEMMGNNKDHGEAGNKMQSQLALVYSDIIEKYSVQDFRSCWSILLLFAKLHRDTSFSSSNINRYSHLWTGTERKLTGFQMLNNIVLLTCDPATRARNVRMQIDFSKSLEKFYSPEGAQRVVSYYKS